MKARVAMLSAPPTNLPALSKQICAECGSLMLRLDEDVFQPYFDKQDALSDISSVAEIGEFLGEERTSRHVYGEPLLLRPAAPRAAGAGATTPAAIFHKYYSY